MCQWRQAVMPMAELAPSGLPPVLLVLLVLLLALLVRLLLLLLLLLLELGLVLKPVPSAPWREKIKYQKRFSRMACRAYHWDALGAQAATRRAGTATAPL